MTDTTKYAGKKFRQKNPEYPDEFEIIQSGDKVELRYDDGEVVYRDSGWLAIYISEFEEVGA